MQMRLNTLVAGRPADIVDMICLAPGHQLLAREAGIGAQQDAHMRPVGTDCGDDVRHLLDGAGAGVDVRAAQLGGEQMAAAEDVERQVAIAAVVGVEEAALLAAVHGIVGGVEIEDDLLRRPAMRLEEEVDEERLDRRRIVGDLVVARRRGARALEPVQGRLAGYRRAAETTARELAGEHRHDRIVAQRIVIVQVLVAERQPEDPLHDQRLDLVLDRRAQAPIGEAGGQASDEIDRPIGSAEQQRAGIGGDHTAVE